MKKIIVAFALLCSLSVTVCFAKEPKNLDTIKNSLIKYHDSGEYERDIARTTDQAMQYLKTRLQSEKRKPHNKKLAIVINIDETALSNYPDMLKMNFGGTTKEIEEAEGAGNDPANAPILELFRYAKANNVAVFFITGRREIYRAGTEKNLAAAEYKNYDGLTLKPMDYNEKTAAIYKTRTRESIEKQGYDIVLNIGDQQSDLAGGHADKTFKLTDPYYFIP